MTTYFTEIPGWLWLWFHAEIVLPEVSFWSKWKIFYPVIFAVYLECCHSLSLLSGCCSSCSFCTRILWKAHAKVLCSVLLSTFTKFDINVFLWQLCYDEGILPTLSEKATRTPHKSSFLCFCQCFQLLWHQAELEQNSLKQQMCWVNFDEWQLLPKTGKLWHIQIVSCNKIHWRAPTKFPFFPFYFGSFT